MINPENMQTIYIIQPERVVLMYLGIHSPNTHTHTNAPPYTHTTVNEIRDNESEKGRFVDNYIISKNERNNFLKRVSSVAAVRIV